MSSVRLAWMKPLGMGRRFRARPEGRTCLWRVIREPARKSSRKERKGPTAEICKREGWGDLNLMGL